jgi:hypothetical protein
VSPEDIEKIRLLIREEHERLEARLRGRRVNGKRRLRSPEAAAASARSVAKPSALAISRASTALRRIREKG